MNLQHRLYLNSIAHLQTLKEDITDYFDEGYLAAGGTIFLVAVSNTNAFKVIDTDGREGDAKSVRELEEDLNSVLKRSGIEKDRRFRELIVGIDSGPSVEDLFFKSRIGDDMRSRASIADSDAYAILAIDVALGDDIANDPRTMVGRDGSKATVSDLADIVFQSFRQMVNDIETEIRKSRLDNVQVFTEYTDQTQ
jgi:hypothetical protein